MVERKCGWLKATADLITKKGNERRGAEGVGWVLLRTVALLKSCNFKLFVLPRVCQLKKGPGLYMASLVNVSLGV